MNAYVGEIMCVGFNFAPQNWAICDGRSLPIDQYDALFSLLGTTFGGDGITTFNLPDLRGRTAISSGQLAGGSNYIQGQNGGAEQVTLTLQNYPAHSHPLNATSANGSSTKPAGNLLAAGQSIYNSNTPQIADALSSQAVTPAPGSSQPHENLQPYVTCNWVISLYGIYPPRS